MQLSDSDKKKIQDKLPIIYELLDGEGLDIGALQSNRYRTLMAEIKIASSTFEALTDHQDQLSPNKLLSNIRAEANKLELTKDLKTLESWLYRLSDQVKDIAKQVQDVRQSFSIASRDFEEEQKFEVIEETLKRQYKATSYGDLRLAAELAIENFGTTWLDKLHIQESGKEIRDRLREIINRTHLKNSNTRKRWSDFKRYATESKNAREQNRTAGRN